MEDKSGDIKGQTIVFNLNETDKAETQREEQAVASSSDAAKIDGSSKKPTCIIVLGMAGSGKTTFVQHIASHLHSQAKENRRVPYVVNLDPACMEVSINILKYQANGSK